MVKIAPEDEGASLGISRGPCLASRNLIKGLGSALHAQCDTMGRELAVTRSLLPSLEIQDQCTRATPAKRLTELTRSIHSYSLPQAEELE